MFLYAWYERCRRHLNDRPEEVRKGPYAMTMSSRLDQAIEDAGYGRLAEATAAAWRRLAAEQPVLRGVPLPSSERSGRVASSATRSPAPARRCTRSREPVRAGPGVE